MSRGRLSYTTPWDTIAANACARGDMRFQAVKANIISMFQRLMEGIDRAHDRHAIAQKPRD